MKTTFLKICDIVGYHDYPSGTNIVNEERQFISTCSGANIITAFARSDCLIAKIATVSQNLVEDFNLSVHNHYI